MSSGSEGSSKMVKAGIYKHYKNGRLYRVLGEGHHSETLEPLVFYKALYSSEEFGDQALWVRPKGMFEEEVEHEGKRVPRFSLVDKLDTSLGLTTMSSGPREPLKEQSVTKVKKFPDPL